MSFLKVLSGKNPASDERNPAWILHHGEVAKRGATAPAHLRYGGQRLELIRQPSEHKPAYPHNHRPQDT